MRSSSSSAFWLCLSALVAVVVAALVAVNYPAFHGRDYQQLPAAAKQKMLWKAVLTDNSTGSWPNALELAQLFVESMDVTFDTVADDMPYQYFNLTRREKLIHSVGATGLFKWKSIGNHNYTGLFQGADYGVIRLSAAAKPDPSSSHPLAPGMALKFLRDGVPSANFVAMFALTGQNCTNFFEHDFTNHVPDLGKNAPFQFRAIKAAFAKASKWPTFVGLSDVAKYTQDGKLVSKPVFPFRLVFHPTTAIHKMFPSNTPKSFLDILKAVPTGPLYQVYAQGVAEGDYMNLQLIGQVELTTPLATSDFADSLLFYKHQRMEDDFAIHPEWIPGAQAIIAKQQADEGEWTFPDLPWN
ncbi:hypothetical protein QOT17_018455 [Balamuthia mandrillaris]